MAPVYLLLALIGAIVPYARFVPWVAQHGLDLRLFMTELFSTRIGGFFGLDVLIAALVLIVFVRREGARLQMKLLWLPIAATCLIGVSCGLPLFLFLRERHIVAGGKPA
jgi:hypothetical protein